MKKILILSLAFLACVAFSGQASALELVIEGDYYLGSINDGVNASEENEEKWIDFFGTAFRKRYARSYLQRLGEPIVSEMGYDFNLICREINSLKTENRDLLKDLYFIAKYKVLWKIEWGIWRHKIFYKKEDNFPLH